MDDVISLALAAELRTVTVQAPARLYAIVLQENQCRLPVPRRDWALPPAAEVLAISAATLSGIIAPTPGLHGIALRFRPGARFAWTDLEMYGAAGHQAREPPFDARYLIAATRDDTVYQARLSPSETRPSTLAIPPGLPLPYNPTLQALRRAAATAASPALTHGSTFPQHREPYDVTVRLDDPNRPLPATITTAATSASEAIARAAVTFALTQRLARGDARIVKIDSVTRDGQDIELS